MKCETENCSGYGMGKKCMHGFEKECPYRIVDGVMERCSECGRKSELQKRAAEEVRKRGADPDTAWSEEV